MVEYLSPKEQTEVRILVGPQKTQTPAPLRVLCFCGKRSDVLLASKTASRGRKNCERRRAIICDRGSILTVRRLANRVVRQRKNPLSGTFLFLDLFKGDSLSKLWIVLFEFNLVVSKLLSVLAGIDQRARARAQFDEIVL